MNFVWKYENFLGMKSFFVFLIFSKENSFTTQNFFYDFGLQ